jgi:DNA topoisomerase IB
MSLINLKGPDWLLVNHTTTEGKYPISHHKPKYREMPFDKVPVDNEGFIAAAKIDGAHAVAILAPGKHPRLFSYRKSKREVPLEYTFKMPTAFQTVRWPKGQGTMLVRGEVFGLGADGRAIPENDLGRVLNSHVDKARQYIKDNKVEMRFAPFQVESVGGRAFEKPYEEHLTQLNRVTRFLPNSTLPTMARTTAEKKKLMQSIQSGKLKETSEGVVLWNLLKHDRPTKAKIKPDFDVYVKDVFPEQGKRGKLAGGFTFSHTPGGPAVGRVGTGFNHALKKDMIEHPEKYRGMTARVEALRKFQSGALRAAAFKGWHHEKSGPRSAEVKQASFNAAVPPGAEVLWRSKKPEGNEKGLIAIYKDQKGRRQYLYSQAHWDQAGSKKWERLNQLMADMPKLREGIDKGLQSKSETQRQAFEILKLMDLTGMRVGTNRDLKASQKAFGTSTLGVKHVNMGDNQATLAFTGKKGVQNSYTITDPRMLEILKFRLKDKLQEDALFPDTSDTSVRRAIWSVSPEGRRYQVKDLRTARATELARKALAGRVADKKVQKDVASQVAAALSNTPNVALKHYIDPSVFAVKQAALRFFKQHPQGVIKRKLPNIQELQLIEQPQANRAILGDVEETVDDHDSGRAMPRGGER